MTKLNSKNKQIKLALGSDQSFIGLTQGKVLADTLKGFFETKRKLSPRGNPIK